MRHCTHYSHTPKDQVGIIDMAHLGTPEAEKDLLAIQTLADLEGCSKQDKCWSCLFCSGGIAEAFRMCCDKKAHGSHMLSPEHTFKVSTFQAVRDFRISRGLTVPRILHNGELAQKQAAPQQRYGHQQSKRPKVGDFFHRGRGGQAGKGGQRSGYKGGKKGGNSAQAKGDGRKAKGGK